MMRAVLAMLLGLMPAIALSAEPQIIREQRTVIVQGVKETWQLVWDGEPRSVCGEVYMAVTNPCRGIGYGEYGKLWLVRKRGALEIERMDLRPLFGGFDSPNADKLKDMAYLQRWPYQYNDVEREDRDPNFMATVKRRPETVIMQLADYNRDGNATEFLIQVGTIPGTDPIYAVVGVSSNIPRLHALASPERPGNPLLMTKSAWAALLKSPGPTTAVFLICGNHGSSEHIDFVVSAKAGDIHVKQRTSDCAHDGVAESLKEEHDL